MPELSVAAARPKQSQQVRATPSWSVYILRCRDDSLYTGIATDVIRRLDEHERGAIGAKYLRGRAPYELVFQQQIGNRSLASKIEYRIKKLPRSEKKNIADLPALVDTMIQECSAPQ